MTFDVNAIRAEFPILSRQVHGKPLVYFDNAASAQKPDAVIDAMANAMRHSYANVHRGLHTLANETTQAYEDARESVRRFINAGSVDEIVFTKGGTQAINIVAAGIGASIKPGDEIVLSIMEHHSNIVPWHFLRERKGAVLKWVELHAGWLARHGQSCEAAVAEDEASGADAHVERAGHSAGCEDGDRHGACRGRGRAAGWLPGGGEPRGRRAGAGCGFLCRHGPQDLRSHRYRLSLWEEGQAGGACPHSRAAAR